MSGISIPEKGWGRRLRDEVMVAFGGLRDDPPRNPDLPAGLIQVGTGENGRPIIGRLGPEIHLPGINDPPQS